jgi:hypothetical protein
MLVASVRWCYQGNGMGQPVSGHSKRLLMLEISAVQ